jgi:hypothetical protein
VITRDQILDAVLAGLTLGSLLVYALILGGGR